MSHKLILNAVNTKLDIDCTKKTRVYTYVYARAIYIKLCRELLKMSKHHIAKTLSYNHATIINALKKFDSMMSDSNEHLEAYKELKETLAYLSAEDLEITYVPENVIKEIQNLKRDNVMLKIEAKKIAKETPVIKKIINAFTPEQLNDFIEYRLKPFARMNKIEINA